MEKISVKSMVEEFGYKSDINGDSKICRLMGLCLLSVLHIYEIIWLLLKYNKSYRGRVETCGEHTLVEYRDFLYFIIEITYLIFGIEFRWLDQSHLLRVYTRRQKLIRHSLTVDSVSMPYNFKK